MRRKEVSGSGKTLFGRDGGTILYTIVQSHSSVSSDRLLILIFYIYSSR